ncbi:MAG: polyprenol monophosphomannose synthase [Acidobacteriota bacterium]
MKILIVVPTYNERDNVEPLTKAVMELRLPVDLLFVDDASPDGTGEVVDHLATEMPGVFAIHRSGKQGLGTAYVTGFRWGLARDYTDFVEMDGDFSHDPAALPAFCETGARYDVVVGSRYLRGVSVVDWPLRRLALSFFANGYVRVITGLPFTDATSGFRLYRRRVLEALDLDTLLSDGYAFQIEMLYRAHRLGFRIGEIPIIFYGRHSGVSKLGRKVVWEAMWLPWRLRLRR